MEKPTERVRKTPRRRSRRSNFGSHTPPPPSPRSTSEDSSENTNSSPKSVREAVHRLSIAVENLKVDAEEAEFALAQTARKQMKKHIVTVNLLRITNISYNKESMYLHIHDSTHSFTTKSIEKDILRSSFEFEFRDLDRILSASIKIYIKSTESDEIIYATSIDDFNSLQQVLKLRPMSLDPDDEDSELIINSDPKIWISLEVPCTLLIEIISASVTHRNSSSGEDAYASFATLACNGTTYKTKLVHHGDTLKWEGEIFALHFPSREKLATSEIKISVVDWDIEDVVLGNVTFRGDDLEHGTHKLNMRGLDDGGDDHVPLHISVRVKMMEGIVSSTHTTL